MCLRTNAYRILDGKPLAKYSLGGTTSDQMITLRWFSGRYFVIVRGEWNWLRIVSNGGLRL
jgi:hypothetical protein